jgi:hypothetical protein
MSSSLSYLDSALQRWPAARRQMRISAMLYPLHGAVFPGLWVSAGLGVVVAVSAGLWVIGAPILAALPAAAAAVLGGWIAFSVRFYDLLGAEGSIGDEVRRELLSGAQLFFEETGEAIWVGGDPSELPLRQLPALITETLRARR